MRILVTGGSGFLGSAFVRAGLARGHSLAVLTRGKSLSSKDGLTLLVGTLTEPPWAAIEHFAPEACLHAAWIATPGVYLESPENRDWARWSLAFLERLSVLGVRHFTVLGTCIEYQISGRPLREDATPIAPLSLYARCKHELHQSLRGVPVAAATTLHPPTSQSPFFSVATRLSWARIFYPYGTGEHPARLASSIIGQVTRGELVKLKTPGSIKDYVHADDVGAALLTLVEQRYNGDVNVGTGEGITVETIARSLATLLGRPELVQMPANPTTDPLDFVVADSARLRALGWRPQITLAAGLRRLVEAHRR